MESIHFKTTRTSKICILGDVENASNVWITLHGYGQLTAYFIRNFKCLEEKGIAVIAPEGLSKFYLNGSSGRVGASWMTKEDREIEIEDYLYYLDSLYEHFELFNKEHITLLGFSQGGATAARWYHSTTHHINQLVMWASLFPPEMLNKKLKHKSSNKLLVFGDNDEYLSLDYLKTELKQNAFYSDVKLITFKGGHKIDQRTLMEIA